VLLIFLTYHICRKDKGLTLRRPLEGLKIVEVASMVSAPYCGKILADLGAEVIKVEEPISGDQLRRLGPFFEDVPEPDNSILFFYINLGKLGITLDLRRSKGRDVLYRLLREADVLIEDVSPGKKSDFGLEPEKIEKIEPQPIHLSVTAMGCTGPNKDYRTHHLNRYMAGGDGAFVFVDNKYLDSPPLQGPGYLADYEAGVGAATAVLGACFHRHLSGKGQFIDFSAQEWCLTLNGAYLAKYPNENILMDRHKMEYKLGGLYECRDGHIIVMILADNHWWRMIKAMGDPPWAFEERVDTQSKRLSLAAELNGYIQEWFRNHTKEELYHLLQTHRIPAAPVNSPREVMGSAQLKSRDFFITRDHPRAGKLTMPSVPYRFSEGGYKNPSPAPSLGEHNQYIYGRLGFADKEIEELRCEGII